MLWPHLHCSCKVSFEARDSFARAPGAWQMVTPKVPHAHPPLPVFLEVLILKDFKSLFPEVLILGDFKSLCPEVLILKYFNSLNMRNIGRNREILEVLILVEFKTLRMNRSGRLENPNDLRLRAALSTAGGARNVRHRLRCAGMRLQFTPP
jgi:hypothetical protein